MLCIYICIPAITPTFAPANLLLSENQLIVHIYLPSGLTITDYSISYM